MAHFTKEEIAEIQRRLAAVSVKDSQFPETSTIELEDFVAIVQMGINKKIPLSILYDEIIKAIADKSFVVVQPVVKNGSTILRDGESADVRATVMFFNEDVTDKIPPSFFTWERSSGDPVADNDWNSVHAGIGPDIHITRADVNKSCTFYCLVPLEFIKYIN